MNPYTYRGPVKAFIRRGIHGWWWMTVVDDLGQRGQAVPFQHHPNAIYTADQLIRRLHGAGLAWR